MKDEELNTWTPTEDHVKQLGRTYQVGNTLWCALSATGIEFTMTGSRCELILLGDNMADAMSGAEHYARVGIYVNDELVADELLKKSMQTITAFQSDSEKTVTIRVIKLSESSDSTMGIHGIRTDAKTIAPTAEKAVKIEYIGDSITCGYGVDGVLGDVYATSNENATKSYAYLSARAVDADYSMVSYSGYGIVSGWTGDGTIQEKSLVPLYYTKLGNSFGKFDDRIEPNSVEWDFRRFQPDIVVLNLGTNDASYCGDKEERCKVYQKKYTEFLKVIRKKNPEATILCSLGIMGDSLYPYLNAAVEDYCRETGDDMVQMLHFNEQDGANGYAVDSHPSAVSQQQAADQLIPKLREILTSRLDKKVHR